LFEKRSISDCLGYGSESVGSGLAGGVVAAVALGVLELHGFGVIAEASGGAQVITLLASVPLTDEAGDSQHYLGDDRRRPPLCRTGGCCCW
jgi:hypothetical protein